MSTLQKQINENREAISKIIDEAKKLSDLIEATSLDKSDFIHTLDSGTLIDFHAKIGDLLQLTEMSDIGGLQESLDEKLEEEDLLNSTTETISYPGADSAGNNGVIIGYDSGENTTGEDLSLYGWRSGQNQLGDNVTGIGSESAKNNEGSEVVGVGNSSAKFNLGSEVTFIGSESGEYNLADACVGVGDSALKYNESDENIEISAREEAFFENTSSKQLFGSASIIGQQIVIALHGFGIPGDYVNLKFVGSGGGILTNHIYQFYIVDVDTIELVTQGDGDEKLDGTESGILSAQYKYYNTIRIGNGSSDLIDANNQASIGGSSLELLKTEAAIEAGGYRLRTGETGTSGSFTTSSGTTVTVVNGIITNIS